MSSIHDDEQLISDESEDSDMEVPEYLDEDEDHDQSEEDDEVHDPSIHPNMSNLSYGSHYDSSDSEEPDFSDPDFDDLKNHEWPAASQHVDNPYEIDPRNQLNKLTMNYEKLLEQHYLAIESRDNLEQRSNIWAEKEGRKKAALRRRIKELEKELEKKRRTPELPWRKLLRDFLNGVHGHLDYHSIYRKMCRQENMSMTLVAFHPDFNLLMENSSGRQKYMSRGGKRLQNRPDEDISPLLERPPFPFERLPPEIQAKIFRLVFVRAGQIHCLSRLDPFVAPSDFPANDELNRSQLPTRFHVGSSPCQIRRAHRPNDILKPLLVCKRWLYIGVHAFYGANTFALSSLGEFERFFNGIGKARAERIAHLTLMWHGAIMAAQNPQVSQRTQGLAWLTKTRRLVTLEVFISECSKSRTRRRHEFRTRKVQNNKVPQLNQRPSGGLFDEDDILEDSSDENSDEDLYLEDESDGDQPRRHQRGRNQVPDQGREARLTAPELLTRRTIRQPDFRMFRSMYTVQGMDYIRQLRGMKWVRFMERYGDEHGQAIRNWAFTEEINRLAFMPKGPKLALKSELENLTPLTGLEDWRPTEQDIHIIKMFYEETATVDLVGGSDTSASVGGSSGGSDGDSSGGDDHPSGPNNGDGDRMDVHTSSSSSSGDRLFVREGSGSPGGPPSDPPGSSHGGSPANFPGGPSGTDDLGDHNSLDGDGGAPASGPSTIMSEGRIFPYVDLTGIDDDEEEGLFVSPDNSSASSEKVKSEVDVSERALSNRIGEMSMGDDPDSDSDRGFEREESPPDSDDESDIDMDTDSNPSSSSKRPGEGSGDGGPSKRLRTN